MAAANKSNNNAMSYLKQSTSAPASMREAFIAWLSAGNAKKHHPQSAVACLDRISEYVISKRMSCSVWEISKSSVFRSVYQKVLEAKLLRITEKNTHKAFIAVGQIYMKFLKEKPWEQSAQDTQSAEKLVPIEPIASHAKSEGSIINPSNAVLGNDILFRKEVDWSVLHYGLTVPQAVVASFCANLGEDVPRGCSTPISLTLNNGSIYKATLSNVGFANNSRQQWQIRYSSTSPVAIKLREIFYESYNHFIAVKNNTYRRVLSNGKEYIELACKGENTFAVACFPDGGAINNRQALTTVSNQMGKSSLTIKEAVISVLKDAQHPMSAKNIYDSIISQGLYSFGAQNPINVVRNIIECACDNSTYLEKYRDAVPCFHSEKCDEGRKVYTLLASEKFDNKSEKTITENKPSEGSEKTITNVHSGLIVDDEASVTSKADEVPDEFSSFNNIIDLEEGKAGIREILEAHFQTLYGYSNINILWNAAQDNLSLFLNDNGINSADEFWKFVYMVFSGEYVMSNPHIWKIRPNYPQSYVGVIINLARQLGGIVARERIDEYFASIKQASPINATIIRQGFLMFYAPKCFIVTEAVNLTNDRCSAIAKALTALFSQENVSYIVLRDITAGWFSKLPTIKGGASWTALLLQEVLRLRPNIGYRVVFSGLEKQALDTLGTAVVQTQSEIHSFADVAHRYCYEKELLGKRMPAEDLRLILREAGMLEGNELIYNLHKALRDYRFAFTDENKTVKILER